MSDKTSLLKRLFGGSAQPPKVEYESAAGNVYHCCVHKTGSQWIARILSAPETFRFCGLKAHRYQKNIPGGADTRPIHERTFDKPFPLRTIVTPIYIGLDNFRRIPKPSSYRAFFVMRDPRDILVSRYFSWKHSHPVMGGVGEKRDELQVKGEEEGLIRGIDLLQEEGLFGALRSWRQAPRDSGELMVVRYEDLIDAQQFAAFGRLFAHCDIRVPDDLLREVLERNSFAKLAKGRERGTEDVTSHLRKGVPGDWRNHFTRAVTERFRATTGNLVDVLGYSW